VPRAKSVHAEAGASPARFASIGATHSQLGQVVVEALRRSIQRGSYRPGERLVEDRLAREFGVSRIPVREALRVLATEGLVQIAPRRGASVAALSRQSVHEMIEVRATLEGLNARLAARHRAPEIVAALREVLEQGNAAAARGDADALVELNDRFHDLLANAGRNEVLGELMRTLRTRTTPLFAVMSRRRARETWSEHAAIVKAVIAGDEHRAAELAADHVARAGDRVVAANAGEPAPRKSGARTHAARQ
jgi:DNA-binding GntR family transcriptional regulator